MTAEEERPGEYKVVFNRNITKCAYIGSIGTVGSEFAPAGMVGIGGVSGNPDAVFVETYDTAGTHVALPFHIAVFC